MRFYLGLILIFVPVSAFENHESQDDAASIQVDGFFNFPNPKFPVSADQPFSRAFGFTFLPLGKITGRDLAGYVEASLMVREYRQGGTAVNNKFLQSYGAGLGYELVKTDRNEGFVFGLIGINSDMRALGSKDFYGDFSYLHQYTLSGNLAFGGGLDMHFYLNSYLPYPLIYLDWNIAEHTKVKIFYDTGELKQFLSSHWSVSLGAQYDLFHYGMGENDTYAMDVLSGMVRLEYAAGKNVFIRLSAKMPVSDGERVEIGSGKQGITDQGLSVRVQMAYGM